MSRLRATLSTSPLDREVQGQIAVAERALVRALQACRAAATPRKGAAVVPPAHLARVRRDVEKALGAVMSVRRAVPNYDADDVDLQPTAPYMRPGEAPPPDENPPDVDLGSAPEVE